MTGHPGAINRMNAGCEVSVVYHGTLLDVDGVGDVLIAAVNVVVGLVSLFPFVSTEGVLDLTYVQAFYLSILPVASETLVTHLSVVT